MQEKRVIPCLDLKNGRVVKGVNFVGLRDAGDPVAAAMAYEAQGADELVLLDITATTEERETMAEIVTRVARRVSLPIAVGGGIRSVADMKRILDAGAQKVSVNSAACQNPALIAQGAEAFGKKAIVVAIDAKKVGENRWTVLTHGGQTDTGKDVVAWARDAENLGAGEILLTSMDCDGVKEGYDLELTRAVAQGASIPVVASGGAGTLQHFADAITLGKADAVLAASLFHFGEITVPQLKRYLKERGIPVRDRSMSENRDDREESR